MLLSIDSTRLRLRFGISETLHLLKNAGFEAFDFSFIKGRDIPFPEGEEMEEIIKEVKAAMKETGLVCHQTHAPYKLLENEEYTLENPHYREIVGTIKAAGKIGAKYVVVHPFKHNDGTDEVDDIIEYYRSLLPYAKESGVKIATENLFRAAQNPEKMNRLLRGIDDDDFVLCFDTGHSAVVGIPPEEFLREVDFKYLKVLHLHDNDGKRDLHQLPYTGTLKWDSIIVALAKGGYSGNMNLEVPLYIEKLPDSAIPEALALAEKVGRDMIMKFNNYK